MAKKAKNYVPLMENQMEKDMDNEMGNWGCTGFIKINMINHPRGPITGLPLRSLN